jgi:DNA-directed RNA polymerase specialized sigma24 family protein
LAADGIGPAKGQAARARNEAAEASPVSAVQFEEFHRRLFLPLVRRAMWRHRMSGEDARDIVQEAFVIALGKLKPGGDPSCWFIKVVDHLSVNLRRKAARRSGLQARWGRVPTPGDDSDATTDTWFSSPEIGSDS